MILEITCINQQQGFMSSRTINIFLSLILVLHYLQAVVLLTKIEKKIHEYLTQHSLKSGGTQDHF